MRAQSAGGIGRNTHPARQGLPAHLYPRGLRGGRPARCCTVGDRSRRWKHPTFWYSRGPRQSHPHRKVRLGTGARTAWECSFPETKWLRQGIAKNHRRCTTHSARHCWNGCRGSVEVGVPRSQPRPEGSAPTQRAKTQGPRLLSHYPSVDFSADNFCRTHFLGTDCQCAQPGSRQGDAHRSRRKS